VSIDIPDLTKYTPEARAEIFRRLKARENESFQTFFCTDPGRLCDGKPHAGYPYPHARADQWPPAGTDWFIWLMMGGRGSGKTRTGAEYTRQAAKKISAISLIGQTATAVRDVMIEDPDSGIIKVYERYGEKAIYEPTKRRILLPNGAICRVFSAEEPDRLRGPQHGFIWLDEPAHYPKITDVWDMALLGLRKGVRLHVMMTTTPLPTAWLKGRIAEPSTRVSRVSTYENLGNLAPNVASRILSRYEGTRLGRQELYGEILEDVEGALWAMGMIGYTELGEIQPDMLSRIVIGVDPAGSTRDGADETGIIVVGQHQDELIVLEDATDKYSPEGWAAVVDRLVAKWDVDCVAVERNFGGDMVRSTLRAVESSARVKDVHASRGKAVRAEPLVSRYEQHRVRHQRGLSRLEEEMTTWVPGIGRSPNRVDALVWAATELMRGSGTAAAALPRGPLNPRAGGSRPSALEAMGLRRPKGR
jgi:phage terminase large subunit-like protein